MRASKRSVGACNSGASTKSPRATASFVTPSPARLSAQRWPARPRSAGLFCAWIERTRATRPDGEIVTRSPVATTPERTMPVTTVPAPASVKERSTAKRKARSALRAIVLPASPKRRARKSSTPCPVVDETGNMSAPSSAEPSSRFAICVSTSATRSGATGSIFVTATMPRFRPSRSTMARCSRVCGMTPSSAATTSTTKSMPVAPASMVCTNFSWPGTSTKPMIEPSGAGR